MPAKIRNGNGNSLNPKSRDDSPYTQHCRLIGYDYYEELSKHTAFLCQESYYEPARFDLRLSILVCH
jgi:hypothetical protein